MASLVVNILRGAAQGMGRGGAGAGSRAAGAGASGNGAAGHAVGAAGAAAAAGANSQRAQNAEDAATQPIAESATESDTSDSQCEKCPPDCGTLVTRRYSMSEISRSYQARVTGMPPFQEWSFLGIDFDGFRSSDCALLEAKARYDQFFDASGKPKWFFGRFGSIRLIEQARKQSRATLASAPANLHWHFMQPKSHAFFASEFSDNGFPIATFLTP